MIKRTRETLPAVFRIGIEERRETHAGCPMCAGRRQVVTVINGTLALRNCELFGCGGRAERQIVNGCEVWSARRSSGSVLNGGGK